MASEQPNLRFTTKTPRLDGANREQKRAELKSYFNHTFDIYEHLFDVIRDDASYFERPEPLRHPLIFYFGHTATFFINKLMLAQLIESRINPAFESMFAIGVDEMSWDDLNEAHYDWPTVDEVRDYRRQVKALVNQLIDDMPLPLPISQQDPAWVILMGIEHERIHLETSSVIIRMLPIEAVQTVEGWRSCNERGVAPTNRLIPMAAQQVMLGKPKSDLTYGWDNEYGEKQESVPEFKSSQFLVSNAEYLEFIQAQGYQTPDYWTEEGQSWLSFTQATMPRFWVKKEDAYWQRNLSEEIPLPMNWPVEVNYLEAKAFCNWKAEQTGTAIRLPTEAEWHVLRDAISLDQPDWSEAPGNINLEFFASSCPVNRFSTAVNAANDENEVYDVIGNVWQWTETPIDAYQGFEVHPLYDDFSTPTFDGKHNLMKGGSWISTGNESIKHSRYAFRRHFFQHAGFRYIEASSPELVIDRVTPFEMDPSVTQALEFNYGENHQGIENFAKRCVELVAKTLPELQEAKVLDVGCSVGRSSFEFARHCRSVQGIDFSARYVQCGFQLQETGQARYTVPTEGELLKFKELTLSALGLDNVAERVEFAQGDPSNLKPMFTGYDVVFVGDILHQVYDPRLCLERLSDRIQSQGWLVICSTYQWSEEQIEKSRWLGGFKVNGENFTTLEGLKTLLQPQFTLTSVSELPYAKQINQRRFEMGVAELTFWQKQ